MSPIPQASEGRPLVGVTLVALAVLAFAIADALMKRLLETQPLMLTIASRYVVNFALLAMLLGPRLGRRLWRTERTWVVMLRGLCLSAATLAMALALRVMPVGEAVAILYLSPFLIMLAAGPLLGERVTLAGWIGAGIGFGGVLLIVRPGGGLDPFGVTMMFVNAGFATGYHLLTRVLARTETTVALVIYTALIGAVMFGVLALGDLLRFSATPAELAMMLALGVLSTLGHFLFTAAYREAPASMLAPVNYLHLVWAGGLGWLVFGHMPDGLTLAGMVLVAGAGAGIALRAHLAARAR